VPSNAAFYPTIETVSFQTAFSVRTIEPARKIWLIAVPNAFFQHMDHVVEHQFDRIGNGGTRPLQTVRDPSGFAGL
jgi:hypothetical protein